MARHNFQSPSPSEVLQSPNLGLNLHHLESRSRPSGCAPAASHVPVPCAPELTPPFPVLSPHLPRLNPSPGHIPEPKVTIEDRISTLQSQLAALRSRARSHVVTDAHVVLSPSAPSQPVWHRPHSSLHPEAAVFVQQRYNNEQNCTYAPHVTPVSPSTSYHVPASQPAPVSSSRSAVPAVESPTSQSMYSPPQIQHDVPRAISTSIPRAPDPEVSSFAHTQAAAFQSRPAQSQTLSPSHHVVPSRVLAPVTPDTAVPSHVVADHPRFESPAAQTLQYRPESPQPRPEPVQRSTRLLRSSETSHHPRIIPFESPVDLHRSVRPYRRACRPSRPTALTSQVSAHLMLPRCPAILRSIRDIPRSFRVFPIR
jgi:hypothetical protein